MVGSKVSSASCTWASLVGTLPATGVCSGRESVGVSAASSVASADTVVSSAAGISTTTGVLEEDAKEAGSSTARALGRQLTERERVSNRARVRLIGCIVGVVPFSSDGRHHKGEPGEK